MCSDSENFLPVLPILLRATSKGYQVSFSSSKQLFQVIRGILRRYRDSETVDWIFERADPDILQEVTGPLLDRLERAGSVQPG